MVAVAVCRYINDRLAAGEYLTASPPGGGRAVRLLGRRHARLLPSAHGVRLTPGSDEAHTAAHAEDEAHTAAHVDDDAQLIETCAFSHAPDAFITFSAFCT